MQLIRKCAVAAAFAAVAIATPAHSAGIQLGQLTCLVDGGVGFVFGSSKKLKCDFTPADSTSPTETYTGSIDKYGLDIGFSGKSVILWTVVAAENYKHIKGQLAGKYSGASASAAVAVGLGANVLVGGSSDAIALQPVSVSGSSGLNVAAGFAQITLK
jgi:hypothetical protein